MEHAILHIILIMMIIGALIAIETKNLLSSIISVGAVGFLLAIMFLFLRAPDLAITQMVVEILCLVILIRATISRDLTAISGGREFFGLITTATLIILITVLGLKIFEDFPAFGSSVLDRVIDAPAKTYIADGLEKTGSANIVTTILLDFRAYDTLGEITVLFCAILGTLAVLRRKARKQATEEDNE